MGLLTPVQWCALLHGSKAQATAYRPAGACYRPIPGSPSQGACRKEGRNASVSGGHVRQIPSVGCLSLPGRPGRSREAEGGGRVEGPSGSAAGSSTMPARGRSAGGPGLGETPNHGGRPMPRIAIYRRLAPTSRGRCTEITSYTIRPFGHPLYSDQPCRSTSTTLRSRGKPVSAVACKFTSC